MQSINTNVAALYSQRVLNRTQSQLATAMQRLSSGLRINSAKDDAAGLAITERMTSQIRGMNQAHRNINDAISMAQTTEGALATLNDLFQRGRELAVQAANDSNSTTDRQALQAEINQLVTEVDSISETTAFNSVKVFAGGSREVTYDTSSSGLTPEQEELVPGPATAANLTRHYYFVYLGAEPQRSARIPCTNCTLSRIRCFCSAENRYR